MENNYYTVTLSQRYVDWFLLKMLVSRTIVGQIMNKVKFFSVTYEDEPLLLIFKGCIDSRFKRSNDSMKIYKVNKEPTVDKLCK